jgi:hypothetical protein
MKQNTMTRCLTTLLLGAATALGEPDKTADKSADPISIKGTCTFGNRSSTWSATLTPKGDGTYDAVYVSSWGGQPLNYVGTIKTDLKTEISGTGKASGGRANGIFEFSGKYGDDGIAKCSYKEAGGRGRSGSMTAEMPKAGAEEPPASPAPSNSVAPARNP